MPSHSSVAKMFRTIRSNANSTPIDENTATSQLKRIREDAEVETEDGVLENKCSCCSHSNFVATTSPTHTPHNSCFSTTTAHSSCSRRVIKKRRVGTKDDKSAVQLIQQFSDTFFSCIFDFLPVKDLFSSILRVNKRFQRIVLSPAAWLNRAFDTEAAIPQEAFIDLMKRCDFKKLTLRSKNNVDTTLLQAVPTLCTKLRTLSLYDVDATAEQILSLVQKLDRLSTLEISDTTATATKCFKLKEGETRSSELLPSNFKGFKSLETLVIEYGRSDFNRQEAVDSYYSSILSSLLSHSPNLQNLSLSQTTVNSLFFFWTSDSTLSSLQSSYLKEVALLGHKNLTDNGIRHVSKKSPLLECFSISSCENVTFESVGVLSHNNKAIKKLELHNCKRISQNLEAPFCVMPSLRELIYQQYRCCEQHEQHKDVQERNTECVRKLVSDICTPNMKKIFLDSSQAFSTEQIFSKQVVIQNCTNLDTLHLALNDISDTTLREILLKNKSSEMNLYLSYANAASAEGLAITDTTLELLASKCTVFICDNCDFSANWINIIAKRNKHLHTLGISNIQTPEALTVQPNTCISTLQTLSIRQLDFTSDEYVDTLIRYCPNITTLALSQIGNITGQIFKSVSHHCKQLQNLTIHNCFFDKCDTVECYEFPTVKNFVLSNSTHLSLDSLLSVLLSFSNIEKLAIEFEYDRNLENAQGNFRHDLVNGMDCNFFAEFQQSILQFIKTHHGSINRENWEWDIFCNILRQRLPAIIQSRLLMDTSSKQVLVNELLKLLRPENAGLVISKKKRQQQQQKPSENSSLKAGLECAIHAFFKKCFLTSLQAFMQKL